MVSTTNRYGIQTVIKLKYLSVYKISDFRVAMIDFRIFAVELTKLQDN